MEDDEGQNRTRGAWSTKKKDKAPRGVCRHPSGVWAIRFTCGAGHIHKQRVGPLKSDAVGAYHERRNRAQSEPGWCPQVEARGERDRVRAEQAREKVRVLFRDYAADYLKWSEKNERSWTTDRGMFTRLLPVFGEKKLDEITTADVERFRDSLAGEVAPATANRYTALLSGMFRRAIRLGLIAGNPVKGVSRFKEAGQRVAWLTADAETAVREALPLELRPYFTVSVNTGLRWSEQMALRWTDVDVLSGTITVARSKNGRSRSLPMNSMVRSVLFDLANQRQRPDDRLELVFPCRHKQADKFFPEAVERAQATLRSAGKDSSSLETATRGIATAIRSPPVL